MGAREPRGPRSRTLMQVLRGTAGAVDLASIVVGVIVTAVLSGGIALSLQSAINWTQDNAAKQSLNTVRLAQATAKMNSGGYADYDLLVSSGLTKGDPKLDSLSGQNGTCYVAGVRSASGTMFYTTSGSQTILDNKSGTPDTTWCINAGYMFTRATNTFTNPSFETTTAGYVTTRTNRIIDPAGAAVANWNSRWFGPGSGAGTTAQVAAGGPVDGPASFMRKTWTTAPAGNGNTGFQASGNSGPTGRSYSAVPGTTLTFSGWLRSSAAGKTNVSAKLYWYDAVSAAGLTPQSTNGAQVSLAPNTWTRVSLSAVVPATAAFTTPMLDVDGGTIWAAGDTLDGTGALLENSTVVGNYFDGATVTANLAKDPRAAGSAPALNSNDGTKYPITKPVTISGHPEGITTAAKSTAIVATPNLVSMYNADGLMNTGPARYTGAWVYVSAAGYQARWNAETYTALPAAKWTFLPSQAPASALSHTALYVNTISGANVPPADYAYITGVVAQTQSRVIGFYDATAQDFSYAWSGTAGNSASIEQVIRPANVTDGGAVAFQSKEWSASGSSSLRIRSTNVAACNSYAPISGDTGQLRLGMKAEGTYTALVTVAMADGRAGATVPRMLAYTKVGAGAYVSKTSNVPADAAGETQLRVTFTVPAGATEAFIRLFSCGAAGTGDVWFDNFMIVEGTYAGGYLDGNSVGWSWAGAADASTSSGYTVALP